MLKTNKKLLPNSKKFVKIPQINKEFQSKDQYRDLKKALRFINFLKRSNKELNILFVGTTKYTGQIAKLAALKTNQSSVGPKWKPGTISNWKQTQESIMKYNYQKKHILEYASQITSEINLQYKDLPYKRLEEYFSRKPVVEGISNLTKLPDVVIFLNPLSNSIAINETQKRCIPTIAFTKESYNEQGIDFKIRLNENSLSEILFLTNTIVNILNK